MAEPVRSRREESEYFVLLNILKEAHLRMKSLDVGNDAQETLLGLIHACQSDFDRRFR